MTKESAILFGSCSLRVRQAGTERNPHGDTRVGARVNAHSLQSRLVVLWSGYPYRTRIETRFGKTQCEVSDQRQPIGLDPCIAQRTT